MICHPIYISDVSSAAVLVCPVIAVQALCGGEQGGRPCPATAYLAGATTSLFDSGPTPLQ